MAWPLGCKDGHHARTRNSLRTRYEPHGASSLFAFPRSDQRVRAHFKAWNAALLFVANPSVCAIWAQNWSHEAGPISRPFCCWRTCVRLRSARTLFLPPLGCAKLFLRPKAKAVWQWWNYLSALAPTGKTVLRLNLDETSIGVYQKNPRGIVCVARKRARSLSQNVPQATRRRFMTCVSIICGRQAIQQHLLQFLIGNASTLKNRDMPELLRAVRPNVKLLRRKSAWVGQRDMIEILRQLRVSLLPYLCDYQPILLFDAAPQHTTPTVFRMARHLQI